MKYRNIHSTQLAITSRQRLKPDQIVDEADFNAAIQARIALYVERGYLAPVSEEASAPITEVVEVQAPVEEKPKRRRRKKREATVTESPEAPTESTEKSKTVSAEEPTEEPAAVEPPAEEPTEEPAAVEPPAEEPAAE